MLFSTPPLQQNITQNIVTSCILAHHHIQPQRPQQPILEQWIIIHNNGHVPNSRQVAHHPPQNTGSRQPLLPRRIQPTTIIIALVVVTLVWLRIGMLVRTADRQTNPPHTHTLVRNKYSSLVLSCTLMVRCTIGISRLSMLYTTISLLCTGLLGLYKNKMSPRQNPGSIDPVNTTTICVLLCVGGMMLQGCVCMWCNHNHHTGDSLPVKTTSPFHNMSADVTMRAVLYGRGWLCQQPDATMKGLQSQSYLG